MAQTQRRPVPLHGRAAARRDRRPVRRGLCAVHAGLALALLHLGQRHPAGEGRPDPPAAGGSGLISPNRSAPRRPPRPPRTVPELGRRGQAGHPRHPDDDEAYALIREALTTSGDIIPDHPGPDLVPGLWAFSDAETVLA